MTKSFGGVRALRGVSLEVRPGEVHALLGENGAGKSTLIKILSGVHSFDSGAIEIDGAPVAFNSPAESREAGIAVVYQDLSLVEISLRRRQSDAEPRAHEPLRFLEEATTDGRGRGFLKQHNIPLDPRATVGSLPFAYRQMTEICKALMGRVRVLILDEPTSALTSDEEQILFDAVETVVRQNVGVIYVTHRLNEVFRISRSRHHFARWRQRRHVQHCRDRHEDAGRRHRRAEARDGRSESDFGRRSVAQGSAGQRLPMSASFSV